MPIPAFDEHGLLPAGIHDCSVDEIQARFGAFQGSDRRPQLWARFKEFLHEATASGVVQAVLVDGSFVTASPAPNDIDFIVVVPSSHDLALDLSPAAYNVVSKMRVQRRFGFDMLAVREGTNEFDDAVAFFQQVRREPALRKGLLRLRP